MCPRKSFRHSLGTMDILLFQRCVDSSLELGIENIFFGGFGEPLMDNYLEKRLLYIKNKYHNISIGLTTTGYLLTGKILDLVCKYVDIIKISNYGFTKESYERVHRGALQYQHIKENIDALLNRSRRPYTIMAFIDLPENTGDMQAWKDYYYTRADRIDIWKPHNWGGANRIPDQVKSNIHPCGWVFNLDSLSIRSNGEVSMCTFDFNRELIIGNMADNSLFEIINSDNLKKLQRIHESGEILQGNLICKKCDQIRDRSDALIWTSGNIKVGTVSLLKE
jgi:radical SAM protein with 4Fe4S-binding SPASM domain